MMSVSVWCVCFDQLIVLRAHVHSTAKYMKCIGSNEILLAELFQIDHWLSEYEMVENEQMQTYNQEW